MRNPGSNQRGTPWDLLAFAGAVLWPVGLLGFGGFDEDTGSAIVAAGSLLVVSALGAEFALRPRAQRRRADRA